MRVKPLLVEVWSDVACPWCWVGKRNLEAAIAETGEPVEVVWRSFELDPAAPRRLPEGTDLVARLASKYGTTRAQAQAMIDRMTGVGKAAGIEFRFDRAQPSNTFDAHRLLHWAAAQGKSSELKERLFTAYMQEGRVVAEPEVLVDAAEHAGLHPEAAQAVLGTDAHAQDVRADEATARQIGITGVPFFVIDRRLAIAGAQPAARLAEALRMARAEADADARADDAPACDADGCPV